jgi:hypothetical protein
MVAIGSQSCSQEYVTYDRAQLRFVLVVKGFVECFEGIDMCHLMHKVHFLMDGMLDDEGCRAELQSIRSLYQAKLHVILKHDWHMLIFRSIVALVHSGHKRTLRAYNASLEKDVPHVILVPTRQPTSSFACP